MNANVDGGVDTVVILGTGATIGSGYAWGDHRLPGDRGFFGNPVVAATLRSGTFLVLPRILESFPRAGLGLEEVWTFIDFASRDLFRDALDLSDVEQDMKRAAMQPELQDADEHAQISQIRADPTLPNPQPVDVLLLAGWDIRRLLTRVYDNVAPPANGAPDPYPRLFEWLGLGTAGGLTTTIISLNYDTVLEHALTRAGIPWHYGHVTTQVERNPRGARVLKPHGSLNWRCRGNEPTVTVDTDYRLAPTPCVSRTTNDFDEAMILPPTQLKQPIMVAETQASAINTLFKAIWNDTVTSLARAAKVVVLGYSLPATDQHLHTLCHLALRRRRHDPYKHVYCVTQADAAGSEGAVFAGTRRHLPAVNYHLFANGFEEFVKALPDLPR